MKLVRLVVVGLVYVEQLTTKLVKVVILNLVILILGLGEVGELVQVYLVLLGEVGELVQLLVDEVLSIEIVLDELELRLEVLIV
ncbi:MAG: hypothetical protein LBC61_05220 [Candidatus Peribacteria bacterium]|jgi:hypothetical protein|nr:hypothetical protein [Candidatus Peribacteria bacterium]